ncbi:ATP-binding cassette domain-containing protein [Enterococcus hirae]|nr:ATP-binding cassette domain-containing protein [Enterococcus hirae]
MAYIPQENFLFEGTIQDNLTKGLTEYDSDKLKFFINLLHFEIPLTQKVTPFTFNLSSGQLQKIKLIRTFLSMPDILIIDEALANLDNSIVSNIVQFIQDRQLTTIIVYHGNFDNYLEKSKYKTLNLSNFI